MEYRDKDVQTPVFVEFMPVSIFGAVMGLTALCFAWRLANLVWHIGSLIAEIIGGTAILVFVLLVIIYTLKWIRYPAAVEKEFKNSVSIGFFATVTISVLLIPGILLLFFAAPLAVALQPSLFILVAPFALAFSGYEGLVGGQDITAGVFFYFTLFLLLLFGSKLFLLPKCCPFQVSWWSVSFPLGSVSIACLRYWQKQPDAAHRVLAVLLVSVTTLVILYLLVQTIYQIWSGRFGQPIDLKRS
jgi:tellurite resistance protein TehA-like permease